MSEFKSTLNDLIKVDDKDALLAEVEDILRDIKNDKPVYNALKALGITREIARKNIIVVSDFQQSFHEVKSCLKNKVCRAPGEHLQLKLRLDGDVVVREFEPCPAAKAFEARKLNLWYDDFPSEWDNLRLSDTKSITISNNNLTAVQALLKAINGDKSWIYLGGERRVGKSYLAVAFVNEYLAKELGSAAVINTSRRFKEINDLNFNDKEAFNNIISELSNVDLLVLDGFGDEYINDFIRDTIVLPILNERDSKNLLTIFTSRYTLNTVKDLYSGKSKVSSIRSEQLHELILSNINNEFYITGIPLG